VQKENYDRIWTSYASHVHLEGPMKSCMVKCRLPITLAMEGFLDQIEVPCVGLWDNPMKENLEVYFIFGGTHGRDWRGYLAQYLGGKLVDAGVIDTSK